MTLPPNTVESLRQLVESVPGLDQRIRQAPSVDDAVQLLREAAIQRAAQHPGEPTPVADAELEAVAGGRMDYDKIPDVPVAKQFIYLFAGFGNLVEDGNDWLYGR